MGRINLLEQNVFNMISAGEVVERPSSVVKELVENSIDAGASEIDVYIEEGGTRLIQVSDNGIGIHSDDMRKAFLPHATSKLSKITDLDSLATLGFRGEALASISSVSEVTMISSCNNLSSKICLSGGKVTFEGIDSRTKGTIITVENLFFNTPARLKFLKKPSSEQRYIQDTIKNLILANPHISITLSNEEGELLSNSCGTLLDAIYSIYSAKAADNLLEILPTNNDVIKVAGYTSKIDYVKANRTYQHIIVNGRIVEDTTISTAVERAYSEFLMKRTYPMFVLDIVMPFEDVDVNVHPSKTEVRFRDKNAVFGAVYHAISNVINSSINNTQYGFDIASNSNAIMSDNIIHKNVEQSKQVSDTGYSQVRLDTSGMFSGKTAPKDFVGSIYDIPTIDIDNKQSVLCDAPVGAYKDFDVNASNHELNLDDSNYADDSLRVFDGTIVGQIFDTYIILERDNLVYIIDQHAAHERILYDNILSHFSVEYKQPLLLPYKLTLSSEEEEYFDKILPSLISLGFDIESDGNIYMITAVPEPIANVNFSNLFKELFYNMVDDSNLTLQALLKDKLCQQACKGAIKGGEALTRAQIERVITNYVDKDGNLPSKCPHGRPAVIAFSKTDIEKIFKRIV